MACPELVEGLIHGGMTMPDKWMTVAAAAATLNVHPRTIERRIASGKIESRRTDDGQLQVLINAPDDPPPAAEAFETVKELAQDQVSLATGSASALVKFAQDDAARARHELDIVRQDAGRARQSAKTAWIAVSVMSVAVCAAVGWTTYKITRTGDDLRTLTTQAELTRKDAERMRQERDAALDEAQAAKLSQAQTAGHLDAVNDQITEVNQRLKQSDIRPTTRPATFLQKLASTFSE
jgi:excisionase family DNA binding protein